MSMDPPKVLLERSFLVALTDPQHPQHDNALERYLRLVDLYQREEVLLVAVAAHLRPFEQHRIEGLRRTGLLAPVDALHVAFQHRRTAKRAARNVDHDPDLALTLVMCERHKVRRLATFDDRFAPFHLETTD